MRKLLFVFIGFIFLSSLRGQVASNEDVKNWLGNYVGFEKNFGQVQNFEGERVNDVLFRAKLPGYGIFITERGVSYVIYKVEKRKSEDGDLSSSKLMFKDGFDDLNSELYYARFDVELLNSRIEGIEYEDPLPGYTNYYLSSCPEGVFGVVSYRKIRVRDVYPNIDWVWEFKDGRMHHQFELKQNAKVEDIKLKVKWADYEIRENGKKILFSTPIGKIEDGEIYAYEDGNLKTVDVSYRKENGVIGFAVEGYSGKNTLIIDPPLSLLWATYYGGNNDDIAYSVSTDANGNVFVVGGTISANFPTHNPGGAYFQGNIAGNYDAFILKFDNNGVRLWATYYGDIDEDYARSVSTDANGNVFVVGETYSTNFPIHNPGGGAYFQGNKAGNYDAFILKFDNNGVRLWATYYGGSGEDDARSVSTDANGNVFVLGETYSTNFPIHNPGGGAYFQGTFAGGSDRYDAFILKFNNNGVRLWATYYGGSSYEEPRSVSTDANGNVFVVGSTLSGDFPTYNPGGNAYFQGNIAGNYDAFILKFNNNGVRLWATYYGGSNSDYVRSVSTDANGNVFVLGLTWSTNFPTFDPGGGAYFQVNNAGVYDAFILKFDNNGVGLWATYYGGSGVEDASSVSTDANGNVFVVGGTRSANFPTYNPGGGAYFQGTYAGYGDAFILKFEGSPATGVVKDESTIPERFSLHQNYPNPFNPGTRIVFDLPERASVKLKVYDFLGREVKTLFEGALGPGIYEYYWDANDGNGNMLASGVYFYRLESFSEGKSFVETKKMVLLR